MEMVERILLLQLESEMDEVSRAFAISDIQSFPVGDERWSVCQLLLFALGHGLSQSRFSSSR